ncbi:hybrid sensor histidine kinase/response regulator [Cerasicoccus frondis]|uniref:hybrid sensor histidine kinase/response regulator n=1 Tax=Cerasicoccus frondis TaxID=490090 RepID=UPI00285249F4|nr:PAS domain S-box protein [Cerasicoccus frondis]
MSNKIAVLLVEDNPTDRLIIRELLSEAIEVSFVLEEARSMAECIELLRTKTFGAILLDLGLPDSQGERSFQSIIETAPDIPLLVLTGLDDENAGIRAMRYGAQDYLVKGEFQSSLLVRSIRYAVERHRISTELRQLALELGETSRRLSESETRIRELINVSEDAMIVVDEQNVVQFANPAASDFFLKELSTLIGSPFMDNWSDSSVITLPDRLGEPRYAEVKTAETEWDNLPAHLLTLRDITARKRFEQELVLFRKLIDHSEESVEFVDVETGMVLDCNQMCCQRLGYTREEMLNLHVWDYDRIVTPENWGELAATMIENKRAKFESDHLTKSGETYPVEVSIGHVLSNGKSIFVAIVQDISERKKIENQLRRDAEIISRLEDAIITLDLDWTIQYWSQGATGMFGWSSDERVGTHFLRVFGVDHDADLTNALKKALQGEAQCIERKLLTKAGESIWLECSLHLNRSESGDPVGLLLVMRNIEERVSLEAQLRQAQKMEAIGTLAGGIAHDFNNIMAAIRGYAELAHRRSSDPSITQDLATVLKASERASALIEKILTFSRKQPETRSTIRLQEPLTESIHLLRATIPSTIAIESWIDETAPGVLANQEQVQQIILNLATNAMHAMSGRAGKLSFCLSMQSIGREISNVHVRLQPGDYIHVSISDTGCGMNSETIERIFEPFYTTKSPGEGTGLGLAMVHGIMESHDGAITVDSEFGAGTTFHLYFPVHTMKLDAAEPKSVNGARGHGEHILFVDDEVLLAALGKEALEILGYRVTISNDPKQALQMVCESGETFDLIISDQTMPGMTGLELSQCILKKFPGQRIVLTTGYSATLTPEIAREAHILDLLPKPVGIEKLSAVVARALASGPGRASLNVTA